MSLGKQARTNNLKAYSLKVKIKDLPAPQYEVSKREGDKYVVLPEPEKDVSGNIVSVEAKEWVHNNTPIRSYTVTLQDNDEIYFVNFSLGNNLGRSLANSLLSLADKKQFDDVSIGLYNTKPKTEGGRSYAAAALRQGGEIVKWKFGLDQLPKPDEVTFKGQIQRDYSKSELFFLEQLKELNKVIKARVPAQVSSTSEPEPTEIAPDDEVPF